MKYLSITLLIILWSLLSFAAPQQIIYPMPAGSKAPRDLYNHQLLKSIPYKTQKDLTIPNPLLSDTVPLQGTKFCLNELKKKDKKRIKVSLQFQWKNQFEFAGFYAAKEKGYYKEKGLDVELIEYNSNNKPIEDVLSGKTEFGLWSDTLILERLRGKPVVMLANYFKRSCLVILIQPENRIPSDLKGKKLMINEKDLYSGNIQSMFKRYGMDLYKDTQLVPHSFNLQDFINHKVDGISAYLINEPFILNQAKIPYNVLYPNSYGTTLYDLNLFTSETYANANKRVVTDFTEACNKGWKYALDHTEEIINLILKQYNTQQKTFEALAYEARKIIQQLVLANVFPVGSIDKVRIRHISEQFVKMKKVDSLKNLDGFIFNVKATAEK